MSSQQAALAGVGGISLIAANYWFGGAHQIVHTGALSGGATPAETTDAHKQLRTILIELAFVGVGVLIAGGSDSAGTAILAILAALAVLWSVNHFGGSK